MNNQQKALYQTIVNIKNFESSLLEIKLLSI